MKVCLLSRLFILAGSALQAAAAAGDTSWNQFRGPNGSGVHVHDFHTTILHLMGFDHEKFTYRYSGCDYRLTDVSGKVLEGVLAQWTLPVHEGPESPR